MKKLLSVVVLLCLICSAVFTVGCTKEKTAEELIKSASEKYAELDAYQGRLEYNIDMKVQGVTLNIPLIADIKMTGIKSDSPLIDMNMNMNMEMLGQKVDMRMYVEGEWAYCNMLGMSYKTKLENADNDPTSMIEGVINQDTFEYLKDAELVKNEDGTRSVSVSVEENVAEIIGSAAESMASSAVGESGELQLSNLNITYIIDKDEKIVEIDFSFDMDMVVEGQTVEATAAATVSFEAFDDEVTITPPEGYLNYGEMNLE